MAVVVGAAFVPIGTVIAGLPLADAVTFAIGLLVANVPEGLLPTITLALAAGARTLAQRRALVKRLSAVETLGSTTVICTDKTGTLTENRMRATAIWSPAGAVTWDTAPEPVRHLAGAAPCRARPLGMHQRRARRRWHGRRWQRRPDRARHAGGRGAARSRLRARGPRDGSPAAVPLRLRREADVDGRRRRRHAGDPREGAPDVLLDGAPRRSTRTAIRWRSTRPAAARSSRAPRRRRPRACACWPSPTASWIPARRCPPTREEAERDLCLTGLVSLVDPPRPEVADAVARCHTAGIRILVVTGDHGLTAAAVARRVGIGGTNPRVITGAELEAMPEPGLDRLLREGEELIFARTSPEAKLRIADALRAEGHGGDDRRRRERRSSAPKG